MRRKAIERTQPREEADQTSESWEANCGTAMTRRRERSRALARLFPFAPMGHFRMPLRPGRGIAHVDA